MPKTHSPTSQKKSGDRSAKSNGILGSLSRKLGLGSGGKKLQESSRPQQQSLQQQHLAQSERSPPAHGEEGWFVNAVDTVGAAVTDALYSAYIVNKPTLVRDGKGVKLGDERFYDDVKLGFTTEHYVRKGIILLITNPLYKLLFYLLTVVHTASVMVQESSVRSVTDSADDSIAWAVIADRFLIFFYGIDLGMNFVANGGQRFITNFFRIVDLIVFIAMVGLEFASGKAIVYFLAFNSLRPFRIVSRIRTMRNIVTVVARTSTTLGDVLILLTFLVGVSGVFSLTLFGPALRSRCYLTEEEASRSSKKATKDNWTSLIPIVLESLAGENTSWIKGSGNFSLTEFYQHIPESIPDELYSSFCRPGFEHDGDDGAYTPCLDNEVCVADAPLAYTWGGFDNMAAAMLTTIQIMTLENWSQVALDVMDACTPAAGLFFLTLTMIGAFWAMNLVLATITKSYETFYEEDKLLLVEEQRDRERALAANENRKSIFLPFVSRDSDNRRAPSDPHTEGFSLGNDENMLTEGLLQRHRLEEQGYRDEEGDEDVVLPNWDADSVAVRSTSVSAVRLSRMPEGRRNYVLDLEKGEGLVPLGATASRYRRGGLVAGHEDNRMGGEGGNSLAAGVIGRVGGRVKDTLEQIKFGRAQSLFGIKSRDSRGVSSLAGESIPLNRHGDPILPTATSPPSVNPYMANPFLRSRWRLMMKEMGRQSVASMAYLRSVPVEEIAAKVIEDKKRQRTFTATNGWGTDPSLLPPMRGQSAGRDRYGVGGGLDTELGEQRSRRASDGDGSQTDMHVIARVEAANNRFAVADHDQKGKSYRLGQGQVRVVDHTRGLDELLRESAWAVKGTTTVQQLRAMPDGDSDTELDNLNALSSQLLMSPSREDEEGALLGIFSDFSKHSGLLVDVGDGGPYRSYIGSPRRGTYVVGNGTNNGGEGVRGSRSATDPNSEETSRSRSPWSGDSGWEASLTHQPKGSFSAIVDVPQTPSPNRDRNMQYRPPTLMINTFVSPVAPSRGQNNRSLHRPPPHFSAAKVSRCDVSDLLYDPILPEASPIQESSPKYSRTRTTTASVHSSSPMRSALNIGKAKSGEGKKGAKVTIGGSTSVFPLPRKEEKEEKGNDGSASAIFGASLAFAQQGGLCPSPPSDPSAVSNTSMRLHTYYEDRVFDGEKVRKKFKDYVPRPAHDTHKSKGLLLLSVDTDTSKQRAFEANNNTYKYIVEWRSEIDFDQLCPSDYQLWLREPVGNPIPMTIVDATPIVLGEVADSDSLDEDDDEGAVGSLNGGGITNNSFSHSNASSRSQTRTTTKKRVRANQKRGNQQPTRGTQSYDALLPHKKTAARRELTKARSKKHDDRQNTSGPTPNNNDNQNGHSNKGGEKESAEGSQSSSGDSSSSHNMYSSADSISTGRNIRPVNLQSKAEKIVHIHDQYLTQALSMHSERRHKLNRQAAKGTTVHITEEDLLEEKQLFAIQLASKDRSDRWAQHAQRQPKDKVLSRISRRKGSLPSHEQISAALQSMAEVDPRDGGYFAKITLTAQLRKEIKFLETYIAKAIARKTNSTHDLSSQRVRREAKRGFKIHERRAKTLKGNLLLIMLGDWYSVVCKGAVIFNTGLLLFIHYKQPFWLTVLVEAVSYVVDALLIFDCIVRVWLWSPRKYFALTTSHFFAFVEHVVVWFAFLDLFAVVWPAIKVVRVFRIFRFVSSYSAARRIVKTVQSSIRHLLHIVGFLAVFMVTFTVGGWQIFSTADLSSSYRACKSIGDQHTCNTSPDCVWVTMEQWLTLTNIEYDQMKESYVQWYEAAERRAEHERCRDGEGNCSVSISRSVEMTEAAPAFCRQYQGWSEVDAGARFNFATLFSSFSTVFTVVTKDAWTDVTYNYMENVTPFCVFFFLCVLFIGGFVVVPLLVAILLVNFEENNESDVAEERDAALLDEVRRQLSNLGPENQVIAEQLRLREEKDRERKRLRALEESTRAAAKAASVALAEEARRKELALRREREQTLAAKRAEELRKRSSTFDSVGESVSSHSGSHTNSSSSDRSYFTLILTDVRAKMRSIQNAARDAISYLRTTVVCLLFRALFKYVAGFCDRKDVMPEPLLGQSLFLFSSSSTFRLFCCDVVSGHYFRFELVTFWISVIHCIVTPMTDNSIVDESFLVFARVVNGLCVACSALDMFVRCVAQCGFLGKYAFARSNNLNKADFIAVIFSVIAAISELFQGALPSKAGSYLWALCCLRPLRVVVRSSSVMKVIEAIWFTVPDMLSVIGVFGGATLIFAVIGVEELKGMLKTCQDGSDRSEAECVGKWVATKASSVDLPAGTTGMLMDRVWKNPRQANFDNSYSAIATLMEVCVASQWGEVLFTIVDTPPKPGGAPVRDQSQERSFYLFFWLVISNFGLMNIFVGTVVNSFRKYQSMQSDSFFGAETAEVRAVKQILAGTTAKKRLTPPAEPFISKRLNDACAELVRQWWWRRSMQLVLLANFAMILSVHTGQPKSFDTFQFISSSVFGLVYLVEMLIKICIAGPMAYLHLGFNKIQFLVVLLAIVEVFLFIGYQRLDDMRWFRVSWTIRVVALAKENSNVRRLVRVGIRSLPAMANIGSLLLLLFYIFSICGIALFQDVRVVPAGRNSFSQNLNFRTFPRAMFTLYRVATLDDWGDVVAFSGPSEPYCSDALGTCGNRTVARFFFTFFVISIAFVMLNLFIAVVLENFEISELIPDTLREREEDVQRFRQAWGKMASGDHLKIHARDFVPLLKELPGPRARLQMLRQKQASDPDFNMTEEEMNFIAKKYAFGLSGEETQSYIKSLVFLDVPIIMPSQEVLFKDALDVISRLLFNDYLTDSAAEIGDAVMAQRPEEYKDGFTVAHYYCRTRIVSLLRTRKGTKLQYPQWSRFLDPIFREIYERNSTAVIGGSSSGAGGNAGGADSKKDSAGSGGGNKAIRTKKFTLSDYLREALKNSKYNEEDDARWKDAIREAVSEGSSGEESDGAEGWLPESFRSTAASQNDLEAHKARETIRLRMQLSGQVYFGERLGSRPHHTHTDSGVPLLSAFSSSAPMKGSPLHFQANPPYEKMRSGATEAAMEDADECFAPVDEHMVLLQGRQDIGPLLSPRRDRATGAYTQLSSLQEVIDRRAKRKAKVSNGTLPLFAAGYGVDQLSAKKSRSSRLAVFKARLGLIALTDSTAPYLWRQQLGYDNSIVTGRKSAPAMSFLAAVSEASRVARSKSMGYRNNTLSYVSGMGVSGTGTATAYKSNLSSALKQKIRSALLRLASDHKAACQEEALAANHSLAPFASYENDATDKTVRLPTLDDLISKIRTEKGLPPQNIHEVIERRQHLLMSEEERGEAEAKYGIRTDDVRIGLPGSVFGHRATTCISVPLPYRDAHGTGAVTPGSDGVRSGAMSASSAASSRNTWGGGGTTKGSRRRQQPMVALEPGSKQHELDRLLGILALKKFARRWRERTAARKLARELKSSTPHHGSGGGQSALTAEDPMADPSL